MYKILVRSNCVMGGATGEGVYVGRGKKSRMANSIWTQGEHKIMAKLSVTLDYQH